MLRIARRFRATLVMLLCALSLLLCLAACVLGVRSYWYSSMWDSGHYWNADGRAYRDTNQAISYHGSLSFWHARLWSDDPLGVRLMAPSLQGISGTELWTLRRGEAKVSRKWNARTAGFSRASYFGFYCIHDKHVYADPKMTDTIWILTVPYWAVAALFALAPAASLLAFRRARKTEWRLRNMRCIYCGYDLRASRDHCPECGKGRYFPLAFTRSCG